MKTAYLPALLLVGGYLAFEGFVMYKTAYRLEPLYLYDQFVAAGRAAALCGAPPEPRRLQFERNLRATEQRTLEALLDEQPELGRAAIAERLAARRQERESETAAEIERLGCDDPQVRTLLKRYEIRATRRLG